MKKQQIISIVILALCAGWAAAEELTLPETIDAQRALLESRPNDAHLLNDLGNLLLLVGEEQEAEETYRKALALDPDLVSARFNLGLLFQQTHRLSKAEREFKEATKIDPEHAWAHYQLGVLNAHQGRRNAAIKSYARALRLDPRLTDPAFNPHILDNQLAASATLEAYANNPTADLVPRTYESPRRIAGLLVPMLPASPGEPQEAEVEEPASEQQDADADGFEDEPGPRLAAPAGEATDEQVKPAPQRPVGRKKPARKNREQ